MITITASSKPMNIEPSLGIVPVYGFASFLRSKRPGDRQDRDGVGNAPKIHNDSS